MDSKPIRAFKGFNKDMTCRGYQYEAGKEYEHCGPVNICNSGFHACENPVDCFSYYSPGISVFHEVELSGQTDTAGDNSKVTASHIKIGARLNIAGICRAAFDYVRSRCTNEYNAEPGEPATAGEYGAATAGDCGAATTGNCGAATSRGSSASGANGLSVARGNDVKVSGGLGALLVIAEENTANFDIKEWKAAVVDGKNIKPDTWYRLVDGKFVEDN